jgi:hypothetical protein
LLVADSFREKSAASWWLISRANRLVDSTTARILETSFPGRLFSLAHVAKIFIPETGRTGFCVQHLLGLV